MMWFHYLILKSNFTRSLYLYRCIYLVCYPFSVAVAHTQSSVYSKADLGVEMNVIVSLTEKCISKALHYECKATLVSNQVLICFTCQWSIEGHILRWNDRDQSKLHQSTKFSSGVVAFQLLMSSASLTDISSFPSSYLLLISSMYFTKRQFSCDFYSFTVVHNQGVVITKHTLQATQNTYPILWS